MACLSFVVEDIVTDKIPQNQRFFSCKTSEDDFFCFSVAFVNKEMVCSMFNNDKLFKVKVPNTLRCITCKYTGKLEY